MRNLKDYMEVMDSGRVERFHAVPGVAKQEVSAHSWGVMVTLLYVWPECPRRVLLWCLMHDCAELWTGDVPFTVKKASKTVKDALETEENHWLDKVGVEMPQLTDEEFILVKICDGLDGMKYCLDRRQCGETRAMVPFGKWKRFLEKLMLESTAKELVKAKETFYELVEQAMPYAFEYCN